MRTFIKRALWGTLIAGGVTLLGATAANAAETSGDDGLLSGTQTVAEVTAPVSIVGNAISLLGDTSAAPAAAPAPRPHRHRHRHLPRKPADRMAPPPARKPW